MDDGGFSRLDVSALRRIGVVLVATRGVQRVWGSRTFFVLEADVRATHVHELPAVPMETCDGPSFTAFAAALRQARGGDYLDLRWRARWANDDVRQLYAHRRSQGEILYAQWLIGPDDQRRAATGHLRETARLARDERMVEGAYAFPAARGRGLMKAGMARLLQIAEETGAARVRTYVEIDNAPSLRGCAAVGFRPTAIRRHHWRFGARTSTTLPLDESMLKCWTSATSDALL